MLIDWFTVAAQAVNFLILVWLLKRFLYRPVLAAIDEREKRIAATLQDAERKKAEALKEQMDFQHKNEDLEKQRSVLLLDATNAAKTEREKLLGTARQESEALREKLQKTVSDEFENLNQKIRVLAQQEVFSIARKALADLAGTTLDERMVGIFIEHLHGMNGDQKKNFKSSLHASAMPAVMRSAFELASPQKLALEEAVKQLLGEETGIEFQIKPNLISGIELAANGQKIAWSIEEYLASLSDSVNLLLKPKTKSDLAPKEALLHAA